MCLRLSTRVNNENTAKLDDMTRADQEAKVVILSMLKLFYVELGWYRYLEVRVSYCDVDDEKPISFKPSWKFVLVKGESFSKLSINIWLLRLSLFRFIG